MGGYKNYRAPSGASSRNPQKLSATPAIVVLNVCLLASRPGLRALVRSLKQLFHVKPPEAKNGALALHTGRITPKDIQGRSC